MAKFRCFHPWLFVWVAVAALVFLALAVVRCPASRAAAIATYGAFLACCGVVTIGRPVIRVGGYKAWVEKSHHIDYGHIGQTPEETAEEAEELKDARAVQWTGPLLVIVGTMLNGLSGFFQ